MKQFSAISNHQDFSLKHVLTVSILFNLQKLNLNPWATASPRFIVPDNMLLDAIERAKRDVSVIKDKEWSLFQRGMMASPKSPIGSAYGFMRPKRQSVEISNR